MPPFLKPIVLVQNGLEGDMHDDGLYCVADDVRLLARVAETKQAIKVGDLKNAQ